MNWKEKGRRNSWRNFKYVERDDLSEVTVKKASSKAWRFLFWWIFTEVLNLHTTSIVMVDDKAAR